MKARIWLLLIIIVVLTGGFFLWNRAQADLPGGAPASPVLVHILSPANGASLDHGDILHITTQAWSPSALTTMELWVDNQLVSQQGSEGQGLPAHTFWEWQVAAPGVHTVLVRAQDSQGEQGASQTILVNVNTVPFTQLFSATGQTLEELSAGHNVPLAEAIALNPGIDPQAPLGADQPVILPAAQDEGPPTQPPEDTGGADLVIHWEFMPSTQVDQSYCYQSTGGGWQRVPAEDFSFLPGHKWLQTALLPSGQEKLSIFVECWGWQYGTLKYLGGGQGEFDSAQPEQELLLIGEGFELSGLPKTLQDTGAGGESAVPAPFALRKAQSVAECVTHYGGSAWVALICEELLNGPIKQYDVFIWEWQPAFCWPGVDCNWINQIDGYYFYELDASLQGVNSVKHVSNPNQQALGNPLAWGNACFGVRAYATALTGEEALSEMATYCGEPVQPKELVLNPEDWLTVYGQWIDMDCSGNSPFVPPQGSLLAVGMHANFQGDCIRQGTASAAVKFGMPFQDTWSIQQAILRLKVVSTNYQLDSSVATNAKPLCYNRLDLGKQDWTGLSAGHYSGNGDVLRNAAYRLDYKSLGPWGQTSVDVTGAVLKWMANPNGNHGFILYMDEAQAQAHALTGNDKTTCYSLLDFELQILYFEPGN